MTKKKKEIVKYKRSKEEDAFNSVYMFHNIKHNLYFFDPEKPLQCWYSPNQ